MHVTKLETIPEPSRLGAFAFAWWCRRCGCYLPVDDSDHCRDCAYMRGPVPAVNGSRRRTSGAMKEAAEGKA